MTDQTYNSDGNVRLRVYPANGFANYKWPTVAELNAGLRLEDAVPWENFDFGVQASDTSSAPPLSAKSTVDTRSTANYGGNISFWYPGYYDDNANQLSQVYDFFNPTDYSRPICYVVMSVDGEIGESGQPADTMAFANGDLLSVFKVQADAWDDMTEGDDPFYYTLNFLRNGGLAHYTVASTAAPVLAASATLAGTAGGTGKIVVTVNGRPYNGGVNYSTSAAAEATVSDFGIVSYIGASTTPTITTTLPGTTVATTATTTVTIT